MTCDCRDNGCSPDEVPCCVSACDRVQQALSNRRELCYVALTSGGTFAWYAMPDFVRSRPLRTVLKTALACGMSVATASLFSADDHRAFVGDIDEGEECACCDGHGHGHHHEHGCGCGEGAEYGEGCGCHDGKKKRERRAVSLIEKDDAAPVDPDRILEPKPKESCDCGGEDACDCSEGRSCGCGGEQACGCSSEDTHCECHCRIGSACREDFRNNPTLIGAAVGVTALSVAASVWVEKAIFRRGENRRKAGHRFGHSGLAALMAVLVAAGQTAHVSGLARTTRDEH